MKTLMDISRALALAVVFGCVLVNPAWPAEKGEKTKQAESEKPADSKEEKPLSPYEYVTMRSFVVPLIEEGKVTRRQFTVVLALKLVYEDARGDVVLRIPRIRDALYPVLYRLISFRRDKRRMTDKVRLQRKLAPIALAHVSRDLVSELVVYKTYVNNIP